MSQASCISKKRMQDDFAVKHLLNHKTKGNERYLLELKVPGEIKNKEQIDLACKILLNYFPFGPHTGQ